MIIAHIVFSGYYVPETKLPTNINSFNSPPTLRICSIYDLIFQLRTLYPREFSNLSKVAGFMSHGAGIQTQMVWLHSPFAYNLIALPKVLFKIEGWTFLDTKRQGLLKGLYIISYHRDAKQISSTWLQAGVAPWLVGVDPSGLPIAAHYYHFSSVLPGLYKYRDSVST